jgi:WhiB family redox-sensing transcriptional regulator
MNWRTKAACKGMNPDIFYPEHEDGRMPRSYYDDARRICRSCEVSEKCLAEALDNNIVDGMWGGLTPKQRKTYTRRSA